MVLKGILMALIFALEISYSWAEIPPPGDFSLFTLKIALRIALVIS